MKPSARIYIQIRETGEVIEMDSFSTISTHLSLRGQSSATISLVNKADRWYLLRSQGERYQTDVSQFLLGLYKKRRIFDINKRVRYLYGQALGQKTGSDARMKSLTEISQLEETLAFDTMYRIWIDFRGRDDLYDHTEAPLKKNNQERWYAGFTGIITGLTESYAIGKDASISISCRDYMRLFETTKVVTDKGLAPLLNLPGDYRGKTTALTTSFAEYSDGAAIISAVIDVVNATYRIGGESPVYLNEIWSVPGIQNDNWHIPEVRNLGTEVLQRTYKGFSSRRSQQGFGGMGKKKGFLLERSMQDVVKNVKNIFRTRLSDTVNVARKDVIDVMMGTNDPRVMDYLTSEYAVDRMIDAGQGIVKTNPYQKYIKATFGFQSQRVAASEILKAVGGVMNYDVYFDTRGNLIYQKSRYDDIPNSSDGDYDSPGPSSRGIAYLDELTSGNNLLDALMARGKYNGWVSGNFDAALNGNFADLINPDGDYKDALGLDYHGRNYIVGDEGLIGWRFSQTEDGIINYAVCPNPHNYFVATDFIKNMESGLAVRFAIMDPSLEAKYGARFAELPGLFTDAAEQDMASVAATMMAKRANAMSDTCGVDYNMRPDLQLGRTIFSLERRKLYYLTDIQQKLTWGQSFITSLGGSYGHIPFEPIGDPFRLLTKGLASTPDKGKVTTNASSDIAANQNADKVFLRNTI